MQEEITMHPIELKIIRKFYELLYMFKLDNLNEVDRSLEKHKLPKLTQEEI